MARIALQHLQSHLSGRTNLAETLVNVGGKYYRLMHPASAEDLIDEAEFECDERLPYWAEIWPSAIALARVLADTHIAERRTIELGCGIGLPSVVALDGGALVTATDHYLPALPFAHHNGLLNTGGELKSTHLDWHTSACGRLGKFDLILASDVLYEQRHVPALASLIPEMLASGGEAMLSDPRRKNSPGFKRELENRGFRCRVRSTTVRQGEKDIEVLVYGIRRTAGHPVNSD
ncbi:methyltransferase domain-containing protein [soil metagenome]